MIPSYNIFSIKPFSYPGHVIDTHIYGDEIFRDRLLSANGNLQWGGLTLNQEEVFYVKKYIEFGATSKISISQMEQLIQRIRNNPLKFEDYSLLEPDALGKENRFFKIMGSTTGPIEERSYLFKFNEEIFGPFNNENFRSPNFMKESMCEFPGVESGTTATDLLTIARYSQSDLYEAVGFRLDAFVINQEGKKIPGVYLVVPGPELTRSRINAFIQGQEWINKHISDITVKIVDGIASDQAFIQAHLDAIMVISPKEECLHDQFNHTLTTLDWLFQNPLQFKIAVERFHGIITPIFQRILSIKENNFNEPIWNEEEKAKVLKYIDPCLTLLSARIDDEGKSLFWFGKDIVKSMGSITRNSPWIEYFKRRYPELDSMQSVHDAFTLLVRGLKTAP